MKALILAAGFGTRLLPYTQHLPKPLFTINGRPVLDYAVKNLLDAGCTKIFINVHHLSDTIADFVNNHRSKDLLEVVFEPVILDTGGAIANLGSQLADDDFFVVNADVLCNFDLSHLMACHKASDALATLLVHDCYRFNTLCVDQTKPGPGIVRHFSQAPESGLAFTGIQAISPGIFEYMPSEKIFSSIDVYKKLCELQKIFALKATQFYWRDMGTPQDYQSTSRECLAGKIFGIAPSRIHDIDIKAIAGDGSDRLWFRARHNEKSLILSDHGICTDAAQNNNGTAQLNAFIKIGKHLADKGIAVPPIMGHDAISGQVAVADLGSIHLADYIRGMDENRIITWYQFVIDRLIDFSFKGIENFDTAWACQTPSYSKQMILDLECRYFMQAFVNGYLGRKEPFETFTLQFQHIADNALMHAMNGLMHRDCQSKNIMIHDGHPWFIDFQSARPGPIQYDLASLLIDPYVTLSRAVRDQLLNYALENISLKVPFDKEAFMHSFRYCCISRNLQMLGAFGFLTQVKHKHQFEKYIPVALKGLECRLKNLNEPGLTDLTHFAQTLLGDLK
ncbi:nucleoside-diphosphate-sugar pyrophosphorylase [Desulfobacter hydrogenophilus]|uniref:Nucleoside-diphosphate-sugar pyrophosphorylase n=1 Tax=Desulfobacter hydrogenophilus TaxID=2291 RepID=A0A328FDR9_9BACT|nr:sugar phosphate nucleotidyltransferase [Desulfobacter hydrogenophilus]NDY73476.1 phosphotransferase [Desulfobacter hydrogenophilus]QBH14398.1 nucleoside-diphosphate-sugar pyrophosphorylase [Desulfobacter hydrogenophilus]RAM02276.1 nucleoside-diphosphate-sugar pyrophosphorylase [Desulfobacter hydrogenophilus]